MKKIISVFTAICFLCSVLGIDISYAYAANGKYKSFLENEIGFIPSSLGKITNSEFFNKNKYTVINIQDLHCNAEAQKNISNIIDYLQKQYEISAVFTEGGYDIINEDIKVFERIEDKNIKGSLIESILQEGRLTGSEYYFLKNNVKIPFLGLEDKEIHQNSLAMLSKISSKRDFYNIHLNHIKEEIDYLKIKYLSRENIRFAKFFEKYKSGEMHISRYYRALNKYIEKINRNDDKYNSLLHFSIDRYPVFQTFCELQKLSKSINHNKAAKELHFLVEHFKNHIPYNEYNEIYLKTAGFSNIEELSLLLDGILDKYNIKISEKSDLSALIKYINAEKKLNPVELIKDERRLSEDIRIAFSNNSSELEISFLSDFYIYLSDLLNAKITAEDYEFFLSEYDKFKGIYSKYAYENHLEFLDGDIQGLKEYYDLNKERNNIFVENIEKALSEDKKDIFIVISGGFHSKGLIDIFKRNKISYINIMPAIKKETETSDKKYNEYLENFSVFNNQSLALSLACQAPGREFALIMINSAINNLSDVEYNEDNIKFLTDIINQLLDEKSVYVYDNERSAINIPSCGEFLFKNQKGKIVLLNTEENTDKVFRIDKYPNISIKSFSDKISDISSFVINPDIEKIIKNFSVFAAKNNLTLGDGLIFDIEMDESLIEEINGIDRNILRKMPSQIQTMMLNIHERDKFLDSNIRKDIFNQIFVSAIANLGLGKAIANLFYYISEHGSEQEEMEYRLFADLDIPVFSEEDSVLYEYEHYKVLNIMFKRNMLERNKENEEFLKLFNDSLFATLMNDVGMEQDFDVLANAVKGSIEATQKNQDLINKAIELLNDQGITVNNEVPIIFIDGATNDHVIAKGSDFILVPMMLIEGKERDEAIKSLAVNISHENVHIQNAINSPGMNSFEDEALAYAAQAEVMKKLNVKKIGILDIDGAERIAEAFKILAEKDKEGLIAQTLGDKASKNPEFRYVYVDPDYKDNDKNVVGILIRDKNLKETTRYHVVIFDHKDSSIRIRGLGETDSTLLELPEVAKEADRKGLFGIRRAFFVASKEFEKTLLPDFVDMHYGHGGPTEEEKASDGYKARVRGDKIIKNVTKIAMAICFGRITKFVKATNIITHALYNLTHSATKPQMKMQQWQGGQYDSDMKMYQVVLENKEQEHKLFTDLNIPVFSEGNIKIDLIANSLFFSGIWKKVPKKYSLDEIISRSLENKGYSQENIDLISENFKSRFGDSVVRLNRIASRFKLEYRAEAEMLYRTGISQGLVDREALAKRIMERGGYGYDKAWDISLHFNLVKQTLFYEENAGITYKVNVELSEFLDNLNKMIEERNEEYALLSSKDNDISTEEGLHKIILKIFSSGVWKEFGEVDLKNGRAFSDFLSEQGYTIDEAEIIKKEFFFYFGDDMRVLRRKASLYPLGFRGTAEILIENGILEELLPLIREREKKINPIVNTYTDRMFILEALKELGFDEMQTYAISAHIAYSKTDKKLSLYNEQRNKPDSAQLTKERTRETIEGIGNSISYEIKVALWELKDSIFMSLEKFVDSHYESKITKSYQERIDGIKNIKQSILKGLLIGALLGIGASIITFSNLSLFSIGIPVISSLFFAVIANIISHVKYNLSKDIKKTNVFINYRFHEKQISLRDIGKYKIESKEGNINVPVFIINIMPTNPKDFKFENTGIKIGDESLWISTATGALVVFVKDINFTDIEKVFKSENRKINRILPKLIRKNTDIKLNPEAISLDWANISFDMSMPSVTYDEDGNVKVAFAVSESLMALEMSDFMTGIRKVKRADTMTAVHNIYYYLDNIMNAKDFSDCLDDFQKVGNGQIIIDYNAIKNIISEKADIIKFLDIARINGIKVIVDLSSQDISGSDIAESIELGFDGYLGKNEKGYFVYDFSLGSTGSADLISGYLDYEDLKSKLQESRGIKILNNSDIVKTVSNDRSIMDKFSFLRMIKSSSLLGILKKDIYTEDFVYNAAYNFNISDLPSKDFKAEELVSILNSDNIYQEFKETLKIKDSSPLNLYINKIDSNIENKEQARNLHRVFIEAVIERMLVKDNVIGEILDKKYEKVLGKALRIKAENPEDYTDKAAITSDEFKEVVRNKYGLQDNFKENLERELNSKIKEISADAFNNENSKEKAAAITLIIELIPPLAETRLDISITDKNMLKFDTRGMKRMLAAA